MNLRHCAAVAAFALATTHTAYADSYHYDLTTTNCTHAAIPLNANRQQDSEWAPFAPFIELCPVFDPTRRVVLRILTIRRDLMEKTDIPDNVPDSLNQQILSSSGQYLGSLLQTFPSAYPETITLSFQDWQQNVPTRIVEKSSDDLGLSAPGGDFTIFLWDQPHEQYVRQSPLPTYVEPNKN